MSIHENRHAGVYVWRCVVCGLTGFVEMLSRHDQSIGHLYAAIDGHNAEGIRLGMWQYVWSCSDHPADIQWINGFEGSADE